MPPLDQSRFEILKLEMELIQQTLDKYDDLIFRSRNWFVTIWLGAIGLSFTQESEQLPILAMFAAAFFWFLEGMMRHQYWYKYVDRYRAIRDWIKRGMQEDIEVYDLTNEFGSPTPPLAKMRRSFLKLEPTIVYIVMGIAAWFVGSVIAQQPIVGE